MTGPANAVVIVRDGAPDEEWQEGRSEGPTASEIHRIVTTSRKGWKKILEEKLNGSTFTGTEDTRRGHEDEDRIVRACNDIEGVVTVGGSHALYGNREQRLHRATPDGFGLDVAGTMFGIEVKSHNEKWTSTDIPAEHFDQMQFGMHVLGLDLWLYAWAVEGTPGIQHRWVHRDDGRIEFLVREANKFIEWRAAGAPELDDIPDEIDDHIAEDSRLQQLESAIKKERAPHRAALIEWAVKQPGAADGEPIRPNGSRAALFFQAKPDEFVLDPEAWAAAEPESFAEVQDMKARIAATEAAAAVLYRKKKPVAPTLRTTPNGEKR